MSLLGPILAIAIGVALGFFGGGGSILTVPLLVYVFGLEPKAAIASSLLIVGVASLSGCTQHWRAGNVRPREGLLFGAFGMLGAYAGGRASAWLDGGLLLLLFAAMMLLTATAMWRGRGARADLEGGAAVSPVRLALQGLAVGSFTGLVGAGGGFLIVPALAVWAGLPVTAAIGTSLLIVAGNSAAGFLGYAAHVRVDYALVAGVAVAAVAGSFLGSRLASRVEPASLRRAFAGFVMAMGCLILVREGALLAATLAPALPHTWAQLAFAAVMLGIGVLAGRASRRAAEHTPDFSYSDGGGI
ncbi:MAG: sulfite exporter TauE/SafE family protein [Myxococcota bacterium]